MRSTADIETVGVVGAGTMGSGIAQVAATAGHSVTISDIEKSALQEGLDTIESRLSARAEKGDQQANPSTIRSRIEGTTDIDALSDADIVIEAAAEKLSVKRDIFATLSRVTDTDVLLATNTSTLSITAIASETAHPERVVGLHFMNPVTLMEGVEIIIGERTLKEVGEIAHRFARDLGKTTWESDDKPGFVTNRILMPWINEGIRTLDEGVATKADIDRAMRLGTNVPMGPLELADHIGLDIVLQASRTLHDKLGDRYTPAYLLERKVEAGTLGKKTGQGFYQYD